MTMSAQAWHLSQQSLKIFAPEPDSGPAPERRSGLDRRANHNGAGRVDGTRAEPADTPQQSEGDLFTAAQVAALLSRLNQTPPAAQTATKEQLIKTQLVAPLVDQFLAWCRSNRAARTAQGYAEFWSSYLRTLPGATLEQVTHQSVYTWLASRTEWSDTTRRSAIIALKRGLNWMAAAKMIPANPLDGIESPQPTTRQTYVTPELHARIMEATDDQEGRDLFTLAWETGARPHELRILEPRHVRLDQQCLVIPPAEAKGRRRARVIYLSPTALEIVQRLLATCPAGSPLLRNSRGKPWTAFSINCRCRRLRERLQVPSLCLYEYRHGFAYRSLDQGQDSLTVATLMGHRDTTMLARVYSHIGQNKALLLAAVGH